MTVHQGRHEMPGWRGYLPDSVDRASRGPGRREGLLRRRAVAVGALAACVVAGGAAATQTRSVWRPDPPPGPADTSGSVLARSSLWLRDAGPVLAGVEVELRRVEGVRKQWETSPMARRTGPPPSAVAALLDRRAALERHRETLRAATVALRAEPASEPLLSSAAEQLRAAQQMLRELDSGRGVLGDPMEAAVLRLAGDRAGLAASGAASRSDRTPVQAVRVSTPLGAAGPVVAGRPTTRAVAVRPVAVESSSTASEEGPRDSSPGSSVPSGGAEDPEAGRSLRAGTAPAPAPEPTPTPSAAPGAEGPSSGGPAAVPAEAPVAPPDGSAPAVGTSVLTFGGTPPDDTDDTDDTAELSVRDLSGVADADADDAVDPEEQATSSDRSDT
ncbi:hypothetical protein [Actinomycetospora flava]|uniref:DUF5667 domain-containing protein n=1 Tax=Actinomycetospora flava TaxID=3129232 RepID=A0ABU8M8L4_9PSEU